MPTFPDASDPIFSSHYAQPMIPVQDPIPFFQPSRSPRISQEGPAHPQAVRLRMLSHAAHPIPLIHAIIPFFSSLLLFRVLASHLLGGAQGFLSPCGGAQALSDPSPLLP
eukprot:gene22343-29435_t